MLFPRDGFSFVSCTIAHQGNRSKKKGTPRTGQRYLVLAQYSVALFVCGFLPGQFLTLARRWLQDLRVVRTPTPPPRPSPVEDAQLHTFTVNQINSLFEQVSSPEFTSELVPPNTDLLGVLIFTTIIKTGW